jgi:hypothetical protein
LLEAHILTFDTFRFDAALDVGNFDTITDFSSATDNPNRTCGHATLVCAHPGSDKLDNKVLSVTFA